MSVYSLCFSPTGGTQKVMDCLSDGWPDLHKVDLSDPAADFSQYRFAKGDVCLIGFPVFEGRVPPVVLQRLGRMEAHGTPCVPVAVYGNRAVDDALLEAKNELARMGFLPFAAVSAVAHHSGLPMYGAGRPDAADCSELRAFSEKLRAAADGPLQPVAVPGKMPYIVIPIPPTYPLFDADKCTRCLLCAEKCPVGAIGKTDPAVLDTAVCARCLRCVAICPTGARHQDAQRRQRTAERLAPYFAGRKPNALYL